MSWQDAVTGGFAFLLGFMILSNCVTMYRDKMVRGVNWFASAFVSVYSFWNVYYFAQLGQWFPSLCGVVTAAANALWISMMLHYIWREREKTSSMEERDWLARPSDDEAPREEASAAELAERDAWMNDEERKFYARQTGSPSHDDAPHCQFCTLTNAEYRVKWNNSHTCSDHIRERVSKALLFQ